MLDLDSTIIKEEILPTVSKKVGNEKEMRELTETNMSEEMPFKESFLKRIENLKEVPITEVQEIVGNISLHNFNAVLQLTSNLEANFTTEQPLLAE